MCQCVCYYEGTPKQCNAPAARKLKSTRAGIRKEALHVRDDFGFGFSASLWLLAPFDASDPSVQTRPAPLHAANAGLGLQSWVLQ